VHVYVWLPLSETEWNGRFYGAGGGGWAAGLEGGLAAAVAKGYAAAMTDSGHLLVGGGLGAAADASWLLHEDGVVNLPLLYDNAFVAMDDLTKIAKLVVEGFYGRSAAYSYWGGCSTGGRQGMVHAQRYPENYDGILSIAPAMNWVSFLIMELWPQVVMNELGVHPPLCELHAITEAAIAACDELDGVKDGLVSAHGQCAFDPSTLVGTEIDCNGTPHRITKEAATIAAETWQGPRNAAGKIEWPGLAHEASFYIPEAGPFGGLVQTDCPSTSPTDGKKCSGVPFVMSASYIQYLLAKDHSYDVGSLTRKDFFRLLHQSRQEWQSVLDTAYPDLSAFKAAGGKMIHWHGIADQLIPVNGSKDYYTRVEALDPDVRDFYRYFEVPGVQHCAGGPGLFPATALESLVKWVEKGEAPGSIEGVSGNVKRPICAWPLVAAYKGGNVDEAESFECKEDWGAFGFPKVERAGQVRDEL
jgi:feruloyl esterase